MKVVILCGGKGTRLSEETKIKPKPMVEIGQKPILSHIIDIFKRQGFNEFILALGYKGEIIQDYFKKNKNIQCIDTGKDTLTGGRLLRLKKILKSERFYLTYGDGLAKINLKKLLNFHLKHKKIATITAVRPPARFGELYINKSSRVNKFQEKPQTSSSWINGGFFIFEPEVLNFIKNSKTILEREPMNILCKKKQLMAYKLNKFWQCMDTIRDKKLLNKIYMSGKVPWKEN